MTVKEYALGQIHWLLQKDPWVREIFLAAGAQLDQLAERIMAIYNNDNFNALTLAQIRAYEKALGLSSNEAKSLADRPGRPFKRPGMWPRSPPWRECRPSATPGRKAESS